MMTERQMETAKGNKLTAGMIAVDAALGEAESLFSNCKFNEAKSALENALRALHDKNSGEEVFIRQAEELERINRTLSRDVKRTKKMQQKVVDLREAKSVTIEQLLELVDMIGLQKEHSGYLDTLLSSKRIVYMKKGYKILRFRVGTEGKGFIKLEGYEHVQFLEKEENKGWIPLDRDTILKVLQEEAMRSVKKLEENLPISAAELIDFITMLRDRRTQPELIKQEMLKTRPTIKVGEHGARVNFYKDKDNMALIHFEKFPANTWVELDKKAVEKAVSIAHLLPEIDSKLKAPDKTPFNIDSLARAASGKTSKGEGITDKMVEELGPFGFTKEEIDALLFIHRRKGIVVV